MTANPPIGSVWYNDMFDKEMTVEGKSGPMDDYIQVSFGDSGVVEDQIKRNHWDYERIE